MPGPSRSPTSPRLTGTAQSLPTVLESKLSSHGWTRSPTGLPEGKAGPEARVSTRLSPSASGGREGTSPCIKSKSLLRPYLGLPLFPRKGRDCSDMTPNTTKQEDRMNPSGSRGVAVPSTSSQSSSLSSSASPSQPPLSAAASLSGGWPFLRALGQSLWGDQRKVKKARTSRAHGDPELPFQGSFC